MQVAVRDGKRVFKASKPEIKKVKGAKDVLDAMALCGDDGAKMVAESLAEVVDQLEGVESESDDEDAAEPEK